MLTGTLSFSCCWGGVALAYASDGAHSTAIKLDLIKSEMYCIVYYYACYLEIDCCANPTRSKAMWEFIQNATTTTCTQNTNQPAEKKNRYWLPIASFLPQWSPPKPMPSNTTKLPSLRVLSKTLPDLSTSVTF